MSYRLRFCLVLGLLGLCVASASRAAECESYPNVPVAVTPRFDEPRYDLNIDLASLQAMAKDSRRGIPENHQGLTLGLTHYMPVVELHVPVKTITYPDGIVCSYVERADAVIGYRDVVVYIPQEVAQGTCGFDEVMAHEQKHIAVNRAILDEFQPRIEQQLQAFLKLNSVFRQTNAEYAASLVRQKLQEILDQTSDEIFAENRRRQKEVDSHEEYMHITNSCNGELKQISLQYLQAH